MGSIGHSKVQLISECYVKPKYEAKESKKPHYLKGHDLLVLSLRYTQRGFLYKKPNTIDFNIDSFVEKMKDSLSDVLVYYYPLAGRFTTVKYEDEDASSIHVDCDKGPGARFIHASAPSVTCVSVSDDISCSTIGKVPIVRYFFDLGETGYVCYDGHTRALLSLQITELEDGVFLGISINHSLLDGTSWLHFVNSLSEMFTSNNISHVPILDYQVIADGCSLIQKLPYLEPEKLITRVDNDPRLHERMFHVSASSMAKLKAKANSECGDTNDRKISSFQSLAALLWVSINKARKVQTQQMTLCLIPIDCRPRFNPPLTPNHFGNLAQTVHLTANVGDLVEKGLGWASMLVNRGISAYDEKMATSYAKSTMENPSILRLDNQAYQMIDKLNLVNFSGATRFDLYGVDFGLGKAIEISGSNNNGKRDGMVFFAGGREGNGSVTFEVCLLPENMDALLSNEEFMAYVS